MYTHMYTCHVCMCIYIYIYIYIYIHTRRAAGRPRAMYKGALAGARGQEADQPNLI